MRALQLSPMNINRLVRARGQIVFLHGLEGSADAGYIASFAQQALERGYGVHRLNMRTCGGTEALSETMYHSGLTSDPRFVCEHIAARGLGPRFVVGFSLGANVALKLAGELGVFRSARWNSAPSPRPLIWPPAFARLTGAATSSTRAVS